MNQDEGFHQRWELRRSKVEGDTSSDDDSRGGTDDKKHNTVTDLILFENDEADDDPTSHSHGNEKKFDIHSGIDSKTVKDDEKKLKSSKKKKKAVRKKPRVCAAKDVNRKRKAEYSFNEKAMLNDLKMFADSLVHELAVAQDTMFAHMQNEMRKLVASDSVRKNLRRSLKKVCPKNGSMQRKVASTISRANEHYKGDRVMLSTMVNMNSVPCDKRVPSSYIALPKATPTSQVQNQRNFITSSRFGGLQPQEQFGGFALNYHKSWGLYGENRSCLSSRGVGVGVGVPPLPLHQGMESGSSRSSLSYMGDNKGLVSIARFPITSRASSERMIHNGITSSVPRMNVGEFVQEMSQGHKDVRFFPH